MVTSLAAAPRRGDGIGLGCNAVCGNILSRQQPGRLRQQRLVTVTALVLIGTSSVAVYCLGGNILCRRRFWWQRVIAVRVSVALSLCSIKSRRQILSQQCLWWQHLVLAMFLSVAMSFCGSIQSLRRPLSQRHFHWQHLVTVTVCLGCDVSVAVSSLDGDLLSRRCLWRQHLIAVMVLALVATSSAALFCLGSDHVLQQRLRRRCLVTAMVLVSVGTSPMSSSWLGRNLLCRPMVLVSLPSGVLSQRCDLWSKRRWCQRLLQRQRLVTVLVSGVKSRRQICFSDMFSGSVSLW